ncbi:ATP-binding protein [Ruminococcus sp. OM08-7]|nr:ATP-binding protein [Ruminococcus sp. OM08-7]
MVYNRCEKKSQGGSTMIYEFNFKNFRSYKSSAGIDFTAKPIGEFKESLIIQKADNTELLPVCAIYGPNGGGKSSVLFALLALRNIIIEPLVQMVFMKRKNEKLASLSIEELQDTIKPIAIGDEYYKWDSKCSNEPTEFSILFSLENHKYRYEISLLNNMIYEENLFFEDLETGDMCSIFERDREEIYLDERLQSIDIEQINESLPIISYISMLKNIAVIDEVVKFFLRIQIVDFDRPAQDRRILVSALERNKKQILNILNSMGIEICDINIEYAEDGKVKNVYTKHILENGSQKELRFEEESSGTRKIFSILPVILNVIKSGNLLVIDELDAKLHPVLLQGIIEMFTNPMINVKGAQLLFTSHDLTTMNNKVFRRDEIWFSAINAYDESVLYSLVDFRKENGDKPRNDENYNKQYLEGRYGADPYMHKIQNWEEIECH